MHGVAARAQGVAGAPGLLAVGGQRIPGRQIRDVLEDVPDGHVFLESRADDGLEVLLDIAPDDAQDTVESGAEGVEHRVVDDDFPGRPDGINLLEAAVPASDSRGQNNQSKTHVFQCLLTRGIG